jgi:hypothetical protein
LVDKDFGDHKPSETAKLTFLLIAHGLECAQNTISHLSERFIIQEGLVIIELDDVAT